MTKSLFQMADAIFSKMIVRTEYKVDFHPHSYDRRIAIARAYRIFARCQGHRISLNQALHE